MFCRIDVAFILFISELIYHDIHFETWPGRGYRGKITAVAITNFDNCHGYSLFLLMLHRGFGYSADN